MKCFVKLSFFIFLLSFCACQESVAQNADPFYLDYIEKETLKKESGKLFAAEKFDEIEKMANTFRSEKTLFASGSWKLDYMYRGLVVALGTVSTDNYEEYLTKLDLWDKTIPNSITQKIVLINIHKDYGWNVHRGHGFSNSVTQEENTKFKSYLAKAVVLAKEAEQLDTKDPHLYTTWMLLAMGAGTSIEELYEIAQKNADIEPLYYPTYMWMAEGVLPRWYGDADDIYDFVDWLDHQTKDLVGDEMYARLAIKVSVVVGGEAYKKKYQFDWLRTKNGFNQLRKKYPHGFWILNYYALGACNALDIPVAKKLFQVIGDRWDPYSEEVWRTKQYFNQWKDWLNY